MVWIIDKSSKILSYKISKQKNSLRYLILFCATFPYFRNTTGVINRPHFYFTSVYTPHGVSKSRLASINSKANRTTISALRIEYNTKLVHIIHIYLYIYIYTSFSKDYLALVLPKKPKKKEKKRKRSSRSHVMI